MVRSRLPFWRTHARSLRALGELRVEVNELLERMSGVLKLVGDPYLARAYQLLATRFHLDDWGENIHRSMKVIEGIYQILSDQAESYRAEILEIIVIVLIAARKSSWRFSGIDELDFAYALLRNSSATPTPLPAVCGNHRSLSCFGTEPAVVEAAGRHHRIDDDVIPRTLDGYQIFGEADCGSRLHSWARSTIPCTACCAVRQPL